jgi:hypothetical protein
MHLPVWMSSRIAARLFAPAILALAVTSSQAMACSCLREPTAVGILTSASVVFTGRVEESTPVAPGQSVTTFKVTESFKGVPAGTILRVTHPDGPSPSCGVSFVPGKTYTLAASETDAADVLGTSFCSTWMFLPHVGLSKKLIEQMRELRQ